MVDTSFFINNGPFTLQQVAEICEAELQNAEKAGVTVNNINTMERAGAGEICFFYDKKAKAKGAEIKAEACVTTAELAQFVAENVIVLISANPKLAFLKLNSRLYAEYQPRADIASSARIHPSAIIGQNCSIADHVVIGENVKIGDNCILEAGAVINSCVDRGALDDTVIGDGCRIDNLVQIAHNDKLGRGCVVVAQTGIAGSCTFGDYVVCGGQTGFADHLTIGSGAQIGAQSGLMRNVEPGAIMMGYPAVGIKDFMRQTAYLQKAANGDRNDKK